MNGPPKIRPQRTPSGDSPVATALAGLFKFAVFLVLLASLLAFIVLVQERHVRNQVLESWRVFGDDPSRLKEPDEEETPAFPTKRENHTPDAESE